jgi:DNA-directed RNA polymerase alpha subunit
MITLENYTGDNEYLLLSLLIDNTRAMNVIKRRVNNLEELLACSEADLRCMSGMGDKSMNHIKQVLAQMGLELKS